MGRIRCVGAVALTAALVSAAITTSCGGASEQTAPTTLPEESAPGESGESGDAESPAEAVAPAWESMDFEAKAALMRERVVPAMSGAFQAFDAEEFATFTCATCHGATFQDVRFRMPNGLHPLVPSAVPAMAESDDAEILRYFRFMGTEVVPGMVEILGVPPYNPATNQGFGCFNCHATAEAEATAE